MGGGRSKIVHRVPLLHVDRGHRLQSTDSLSTLANAGKVGEDRGNDTEEEVVVVGTARASPHQEDKSIGFIPMS